MLKRKPKTKNGRLKQLWTERKSPTEAYALLKGTVFQTTLSYIKQEFKKLDYARNSD